MFHQNIFNYINKYGNISFEEKPFNEIDNVIFSLLAYLELDKGYIEVVGKEYLDKYRLKEISKLGFSQKDAYKVLNKIVDKNRYKKIYIEDCLYNNNDMQFRAITFKISNKLKYISFSGTDQYIDSWQESFNLLSSFLVPAHYEAIKYVKKHIKLFGPKVIIGGHSKGGNLAIVSSIYTNCLKKHKILKIYNNDGPGLRKKEYKSYRYKQIRKKYIQIIPHNSIFGILLRNEKHYVVKSKTISFFSHSVSTWCIKDDKFKNAKLKHQNLEIKILDWVDNHNDAERKKIVDTIFEAIKKCEINDTLNLRKIRNIVKVIKELKQIDDESKRLTIDFIKNIFFNKKTSD